MALASPLKTVIGRGGSIIREHVGQGGITKRVRANGADLFIGALVTFTGETADDPDVDLCAKGEHVDGVIIGPADSAIDLDKDADDPFADNTYLLMYIPLPGEEIYLTAKANTAITVYVRVQADGGFIIPFAYVDGAEVTDTLESVVGTSQNTISAVASTTTICLVKWGHN